MRRKPEACRESDSSVAVGSRGRSTDPSQTSGDRKDRTLKNKEELPMNSSRGKLLRQECTGSARTDQPALEASGVDALMELVVAPANLERAWRQVRRNRGAPGPDGMTIGEFPAWARANLPTVRQQLLDGTYRPSPVRRKTIPKPGGKGDRLLGIPNVLDRLIQQAIVQVLTPIFDPTFSESSFGFRPNRSAHGAAKRVRPHQARLARRPDPDRDRGNRRRPRPR